MATIPNIGATRLIVGGQTPAGITPKQTKPYDLAPLGGLSILNGPVQLGVAPLAPIPLGTLHVGPNPPTSGAMSLASIHVVHPKIGMNVIAPIAGNMYGTFNTYSFQQAFGSDFSFGLKQTLGLLSKVGKSVGVEPDRCEANPAATEAVANRQTSGNWNHAGTITATNFQGTINVQSWKGFDINHPTKTNHRLRHICLEGPEAGVYYRGNLDGSNYIDLPEYWTNLVDIDTITVNLTSRGSYQELYVDKIEWGKRVVVKNNAGGKINCDFLIFGKRIDGEPLVVEYEGKSAADYPGDPSQYSISGYDYGRKD
jgi:hypothetical protein